MTTRRKKMCSFTGLICEVYEDKDFIWFINDELNFQYAIGKYEFDIDYGDGQAIDSEFRLLIASEIIKTNEKKGIPLFRDKREGATKYAEGVFRKAEFRYFEDYRNERIIHSDKPVELLARIAQKAGVNPFHPIKLDVKDQYYCKISHSVELMSWLELLSTSQWIELPRTIGGEVFQKDIKMTPFGWQKYEESLVINTATQSFIAMSFSVPDRPNIQSAMVTACLECGFEAKTVDRVEYSGTIVDKIISLIKISKFLIADLTENKNGVYFEAGFAEGLGIPVIYTVKEDEIKSVHFDLRHLNIITWTSDVELKEKLISRIKAIIAK